MNDNDHDAKRREFLARAAKAGLAAAAGCALGLAFHDPDGPKAVERSETQAVLPDFSIPDRKKSLVAVRGEPNRKKSIRKALEALGGMGAFVKPGDRVLLKVNAAFASPPALCATTHPELVSEVARLCFSAGASSVIVTDNPINDPAACFSLTGIEKAAEEAGAKAAVPRESFFRPATLEKGRLIRDWPVLYAPFEGVDKLVGLAPLKDHHRSGASMTMKNWYGLLGGRRNIFHQDVHGIISELAMMVSPTLVILDAIWTMASNGPTGGSVSDLKRTDTMIAGTDQVAVDALGASLLGKTPDALPFIGRAEAAGVGTADYRSLDFFEVGA